MKFFQDSQEEPSDIQIRVYALIDLQQEHEAVEEKDQIHKRNIKESIDKRIKENIFLMEIWY